MGCKSSRLIAEVRISLAALLHERAVAHSGRSVIGVEYFGTWLEAVNSPSPTSVSEVDLDRSGSCRYRCLCLCQGHGPGAGSPQAH